MSALRLNDRKSPTHRPLSAALLCASLILAAVCALFAMAPTAWTAAQSWLRSEPSLAHCEQVIGDAVRLACFDRLGQQALQPPARGALAPAISR